MQRKAKAQMQAQLMTFPIYRNRAKIIDFLKSSWMMQRFVELAVAHYNTQEDLGRSLEDRHYIKPDLESKLDIAEDYFRRDRCGLVEWWFRFDDGQMFFNEIDRIKLNLDIPFCQVFKEKCQRELGFEVTPEERSMRKHLAWSCIDFEGRPNVNLMNMVKLRMFMNC